MDDGDDWECFFGYKPPKDILENCYELQVYNEQSEEFYPTKLDFKLRGFTAQTIYRRKRTK